MRIKKLILKMLRSVGYDIVFYRHTHHPLARRKWILDAYGVNMVLDVGANNGQFGETLREIGYRGKIVSFEPLPEAYGVLKSKADRDDGSWQVRNFALGDREERSTIHVAGNSYSSSILPMLPAHERAEPEARYVRDVGIEIRTLDAIFRPGWRTDGGIYIKIDTQGFEKRVLDGAANSLPFIDTIQLEMSLTPLYEGEMPFEDMYGLIKRKGYRVVAIEPGFADPESGEMLQMDAIFHRFT